MANPLEYDKNNQLWLISYKLVSYGLQEPIVEQTFSDNNDS